MHVKVFSKLLTAAALIAIVVMVTLKELTVMLQGHDTHL